MAAMRKWFPRLVLALVIGVALPFLPTLLTQSVGPVGPLSQGPGLSAGVSAGTFAALFFGGILTSLTPCVYPLIPITVSIFGARQPEHRARSVALSATYVGGIAAMFSALGLFAALSGKAFGTLLSSPAVIALLAIFLVALAASMFGAFEIALPSALQERLTGVKAAGFAGAFGMGLVAGIIAAPCTGPVLAGVLTYVATQRNAVLGFWMLFTYAIGMGVLFFVLGATSLRLPRSGPWMETVKSVLGVALVAAALALVLPLLPRPGSLPLPARSVAIVAGLLGFAGVVAGALSLSFHGGSRERAIKLGSLVLLLAGVGLQLGWLGEPRSDKPFRIPWLHDERMAVQQSRATGKPLLIDFFAEWCAACKELDVHTWSDPTVAREVADRFVALKIDATEESDQNESLEKKYGVPGLPTVLMMACRDERPPECAIPADGPARVTGFLPPPEMLQRLRSVQ
jgi:thiol:disulfide interchange protein DsbD